MNAASDTTTPPAPSPAASAILFAGLLAICFGLGYPAVSRYDPRTAGNYDSRVYGEMVLGQRAAAPCAFRPLTPMLARGVYRVISRFDFGSWDRVMLSMLIVNAVFTSASGLLLMHIAACVSRDVTVTILSPLIFVSSFAVVNFHLAGLIDAGEGLFLTALLLAMLRGRWVVAPVLIGIGAIAKETVVPFGVCAMVIWWAAARVGGTRMPRSAAVAIPVSLAAGVASILICRWLVDVPQYTAHEFSWSQLPKIVPNAIDCLLTKTQVYTFAFLAPMGIPRLLKIPRHLLAASFGMALLACLLGAYATIGDNLHRPLFNTLGPVLAVSSSIFLRDLVRGDLLRGKKSEDAMPDSPPPASG